MKGEGASLMIADFVSADYGWLRSADGLKEARDIFKAGKARDGYYTHEDIIQQANRAIDILQTDYPNEDHILVFDNATTHFKRADNALSARKMPKNIPKLGTNWGVEVSQRNEKGELVYGSDGKPLKMKIRMGPARFADGSAQDLYFPEDYERAGIFKGMAVIFQERGFGDMSRVRAECPKFKCDPENPRCRAKAYHSAFDVSRKR
jgi:hypothetical protein